MALPVTHGSIRFDLHPRAELAQIHEDSRMTDIPRNHVPLSEDIALTADLVHLPIHNR